MSTVASIRYWLRGVYDELTKRTIVCYWAKLVWLEA